MNFPASHVSELGVVISDVYGHFGGGKKTVMLGGDITCAMVKSRVFLGMGDLQPLNRESLFHGAL